MREDDILLETLVAVAVPTANKLFIFVLEAFFLPLFRCDKPLMKAIDFFWNQIFF